MQTLLLCAIPHYIHFMFSRERNSVVKKFQMTLKHLKYVDQLLVHFESFRTNANYYTLPDVLLNKVPVFHMPTNSLTPFSTSMAPELYIKDFPNQTFLSFWKPISSLELDIWHRWLHAHRLHILLNNDYPLPKVRMVICCIATGDEILPNECQRVTKYCPVEKIVI